MAIKLVLSSELILNKVFPGIARGYDPLVVDQYLDEIIKDYLTVEANLLVEKAEIDSLKEENERLNKKVRDLEIENGKYKERFDGIKAKDNVSLGNIELLKKINKYEKFLYRNGYDPDKIK